MCTSTVSPLLNTHLLDIEVLKYSNDKDNLIANSTYAFIFISLPILPSHWLCIHQTSCWNSFWAFSPRLLGLPCHIILAILCNPKFWEGGRHWTPPLPVLASPIKHAPCQTLADSATGGGITYRRTGGNLHEDRCCLTIFLLCLSELFIQSKS